MQGRTYRYLETEPLYPFGYGLSYTTFEYSDFTVAQQADGLHLSVTVKNSGDRSGNEIVQLYQRQPQALFPVPNFQLCGFKRIALQAGESRQLRFDLPLSAFDLIDQDGNAVRVPGVAQLFVGGQQPDPRSAQLTGQVVLMQEVELS